jgi:hypothetical protein
MLFVHSLGKYPFAINDRLTVFPLLGFNIRAMLSVDADDADENAVMDEDDLASFWINFGGGGDYSLTDKLYLRGQLMYGIRFANEMENDMVDLYEDNDLSADTLLGHGLTVKIGVGYRF